MVERGAGSCYRRDGNFCYSQPKKVFYFSCQHHRIRQALRGVLSERSNATHVTMNFTPAMFWHSPNVKIDHLTYNDATQNPGIKSC